MDQISQLRETRCLDGVVILDTGNGTYSCYYDPAEVDDAAASHSGETGRRLVWTDLPTPARSRLTIIDISRFGAAFAATMLRLTHFRFQILLGQELAVQSYARDAQNCPETLARIVSRFERMAVWLPLRDKCLFRSAFLIAFLQRYGLLANWIFGVSLFPFKAHCWVADGTLLLGERAHRIARFRPIFIAGPAMP